jgi:hypothetical protein
MQWLCNLRDKTAMKLVCDSNTALHQQDLAELIKTHFADVLPDVNDAQLEENVFGGRRWR